MNENNIDQILAELYQSDPSLQQHESVLKKLIVELMEVKPDTQFDEQFRADLRRRLMNMVETKENKSLTFNFMKRFQLVGAGLTLVALLAVSAWYLTGINGTSPSNLTSMLSGPKITRAGDNAFGSLANVQQGGGSGGGNGSRELASTNSVSPSVPDMGVGSDAKMIAPESPINYKYIYKGEELTLSQDNVDVLKRIKNEQNNDLSSFINRISLGLVDLNTFSNSKLQTFTFAEDRDLGYMVTVNLTEGSININENWIKWAALTNPCPMEMSSIRIACEPKRIDISQIPADSIVVDAANSFLDEHNIPRSNYGTPFVHSDWRFYYERAVNKSEVWIPDVLTVVYPLMLEGQQVYDESGNPSGMTVSVRISPQIKVSGVWELTTQNYQSSSYAAETDLKRIMGLVEAGGFRNYYYSDPNARTVEVELGTPQISYVKLWNYRENMSEEILVPALIFPVTKEPANAGASYWYRRNVVIPLVKEILDNEKSQGGPIQIMPAQGATEPAVMQDAVKN